MCKISDKLKLCTCNTDIDKLENYWVFHRFSETKEEYIIGEWILPNFLSEGEDSFNSILLVKLLNAGNVFDVDIKPKENDQLQLTFCHQTHSSGFTYGYSFKNAAWTEETFNPLKWRWHHNEEQAGVILNALQK